MTAGEPAETARARIIVRVADSVADLDSETARRMLDELGILRTPRKLADYLGRVPDALTHPEVLARPSADVPPGLIRLAHHLIEAGYDTITVPSCNGCGRPTKDLTCRTSAGRVCMRCYKRDPRSHEECGHCGRLRTVYGRSTDGTARCQACIAKPLHECSHCGTTAPAHSRTDDGMAVCQRCYRTPKRTCGRCGRLGTVSRRATETEPDICATCVAMADRAVAECTVCGHTRHCSRIRNNPICYGCRTTPEHRCGICSRTQRAQAIWPLGPVCRTCYERARSNPEPCHQCHQRRVLVGRDSEAAPICGPCAGIELTYSCRRCGASGDRYSDQQCARCVLTERIDALLSAPGDSIPAHLEPVREALLGVEDPRSMLFWLRRSRTPALLAALAATGEPITHDTLDASAPTPARAYVRELLITGGILPPRNEFLESLPAWANTLLAGAPTQHRQNLSPFMHWFLLRRARRRGSTSRGSAAFVRSRLCRAAELLAWIDEHQLTLSTFTQGEFERWLSEGSSTRVNIDAFISWAGARGLITDIALPRKARHGPLGALDDEERRNQLHRCLNDAALSLPLRVAGALILLFGLEATRVTHLTRGDVRDDGNRVRLAIDDHQIDLPPKLANLVRELRDAPATPSLMNRAVGGSAWLFPGRYPSRPIDKSRFSKVLTAHGITARDGRNSARYALASQLPAVILADLTGTNIKTAVEWTRWSKRSWFDYIAIRARDQTNTAQVE